VDFSDPNYQWYWGESQFLRQEHSAFKLLCQIKTPNIIIDVGAHWGIFPAMVNADMDLQRHVKHIVCVEPDPKNLPLLRQTIKRISSFDVTIVDAAIGDTDSLVIANRNNGSCLQTYGLAMEQRASLIEVPMKKIETIITSINLDSANITHMKIDIDGFEPNFFFGARDWLSVVKPLILCEYWPGGLLKNLRHNRDDYNKLLSEDYWIALCKYPEQTFCVIDADDWWWLNDRPGVCNLLLVPKVVVCFKEFEQFIQGMNHGPFQ
jgi:FkbM family methyltransferase